MTFKLLEYSLVCTTSQIKDIDNAEMLSEYLRSMFVQAHEGKYPWITKIWSSLIKSFVITTKDPKRFYKLLIS